LKKPRSALVGDNVVLPYRQRAPHDETDGDLA
jgi:hypothetical protein